VSMKDEIKAEFQKVIDSLREQVREQDQFRENWKRDWMRLSETLIVPAMKQVADEILKPDGWRTEVRISDSDALLIASKGSMRAQIGGVGPNIRFSAERNHRRISVSYSTNDVKSRPEKIEPENINEEFVHMQLLEFFKCWSQKHFSTTKNGHARTAINW
jgi:hypothetical protein